MGIDISSDPYNPSQQYAFVANRDDNTVSVIPLTEGGTPGLWDAGPKPVDLRAVNVEGNWRLYVLNHIVIGQVAGKVTVLDWNGSFITDIDVGARPLGIDNAPDRTPFSNRLYISNYG